MEVTSPGGAVCDDLTYSELYNELPQDVKKAVTSHHNEAI